MIFLKRQKIVLSKLLVLIRRYNFYDEMIFRHLEIVRPAFNMWRRP